MKFAQDIVLAPVITENSMAGIAVFVLAGATLVMALRRRNA